MKQFIGKLLKDERVKYLIAGGCTTLVNLVAFFLLRTLTTIDRNVCNVIAIVLAIIFAYFVNKLYVFQKHADSIFALLAEMLSFGASRLISMVVEVLGFALLCDSFRLNELASKILVQVIVVVLNYVFSKLFVFTDKKRSFREILDRNWSWLLASLITAVFMLGVMIIGKVAPFGNQSFTLVDSIHQYLPFFSDYQDKLKNEGSLFYTWDVGMGGNFLSLLFYYMASPINLIILLFKRHSLHAAMSLIAALKIVLSAGSFGYFLSRRRGKLHNNFFITAFALAYALNNYVVGYFWNLMWMDCVMVLPLVILGFERLMEGRGPKLYCLSLFYCLFCNYYIAFMVCLFLVLWFLASEHRGWRKFFTDGLKFAGCSILSAGMAAFSLLTSYFAIMTTASAGTEIPKWEWYGNVFAILKQHIFLTEPITNQTFDGGANLYCGTFTLLLLVLYFISERISTAEKIRKALLLALLVISFNATTLNFIWHGFHDQYGIPNRFAFVYIFTLLTMAYEMAVRLKTMDGAYIIGAVAVCLAFLLGCKYMVKLDLKFSSWLVLGISAGLLLVYAILMILRNRKIMKLPLATGILAGAFSIEILVSAAFGFRADGTASGDYYLSDVDTMQSAVEAVADYAEEQQDSFYREDMVKPVMLDEATLNNMRSIGTFCSTVPGDMVTLMGRLGFYTGANEYLYYGATPFTDAIFGVRFVYQRDGEYYPTNDSQSICYEQDGVTVYENPYALPVAFCVRESLLDWDIQEGKAADCQNGFAALAAGTGDIFENQDIEVTQTEGQAEFTVPQDGDYYMNCRGNYMSKLRIYVNGVETTYGRYQMQMFHLGDLQAGDQVTVEITYSSEHTEGEQMAFYISTFNWENFEAACSQWQENAMEVTEYGDGYLKGTVTVPEGDMLFTSVPYDQGWSIYVDGEKVEAEKLGDALIGVTLSPGTHTIEMKYFPRGLKIGMLITLLSWVAFFVIMNKKSSENAQNV